jgi:DNA-3-methyladenine glycosylase I
MAKRELSWFEETYSGAMSESYRRYMTDEWGHEKRGDRPLFEKLCLEGAQAGLSWSTILAKREGYRAAFHGFEIAKVAAMTSKDVEKLLSSTEATIVRHRGKIEAVIHNARCVQELIEEGEASKAEVEHGHFDAYLWSYVGGTPQLNEWVDAKDIPSQSPTADELSKALRGRGFKFVGPKVHPHLTLPSRPLLTPPQLT